MLGIRGLIATAALTGGFLLVLTGLTWGHDPYADWKRPGTQLSCCNGGATGDCYPTPVKFENGQWIALRREDQRWLAIPESAILKDGATADGEAHLCAPAPLTEDDTRIYCFRAPWSGG